MSKETRSTHASPAMYLLCEQMSQSRLQRQMYSADINAIANGRKRRTRQQNASLLHVTRVLQNRYPVAMGGSGQLAFCQINTNTAAKSMCKAAFYDNISRTVICSSRPTRLPFHLMLLTSLSPLAMECF